MTGLPDGWVPALPDDAVADLAADGPGGPLATAAAFFYGVRHLDGGTVAMLRDLVTPGSSDRWGDFTAARDLLSGAVMLSRPRHPAPGMAYAVFVPDPGQYARIDEGTEVGVRAWMTLTWAADRYPQWRVCHVGGPVLPEHMPAIP